MFLNTPTCCVVVFQVPMSSDHQEVLLFRTDKSGGAWPVRAPSGPQEPHGGRRRKKAVKREQKVMKGEEEREMGGFEDGIFLLKGSVKNRRL